MAVSAFDLMQEIIRLRVALADTEALEIGTGERLEKVTAQQGEAIRLLTRASVSLGEFVSDQGWAQSDMDTMDSIDAYLFRANAARSGEC